MLDATSKILNGPIFGGISLLYDSDGSHYAGEVVFGRQLKEAYCLMVDDSGTFQALRP